MILIAVGTVFAAVGALLRMGLESVAGLNRAQEAQAAVAGRVRADRHSRLLGEGRWMVRSAMRVEGMLAVVAATAAAVGWAAVGLNGWLAVVGTVTVILVLRMAAGWVGRRWDGAQRLSGLVEVAARLSSRMAPAPASVDTEDPQSQPPNLLEEREMITSVLEFSETIVREVMVPRTDMITVSMDAGLDELVEIVKEYGFSRFPVVDGGIDHVVGMALAKDLLSVLVGGESDARVEEIQRTPLYVPETKAVSELLAEMRRNGDHMAVVIDEHGGTAGLVTIEDLLEELVGEIVDEHDEQDEWLRAEDGGVWYVDGRYPVDDLGSLLGVTLPQEEWDTVGGLVLALAGRVPEVGETLSTNGVDFVVEEVLGHRIAGLRVQRGKDWREGMKAAG